MNQFLDYQAKRHNLRKACNKDDYRVQKKELKNTLNFTKSIKPKAIRHHDLCKENIKPRACNDCLTKDLLCLFEHLQELTPCAPHIPISSVPYVITTPGTYCVTENLVYAGVNSAITIQSNNVELIFDNFKLRLINDAVGVGVQGEYIKIHGGEIEGMTEQTVGINIISSKDVKIYDMLFKNLRSGIIGFNIDDLNITECSYFRDSLITSFAIELDNCRKIKIDDQVASNYATFLRADMCYMINIDQLQCSTTISEDIETIAINIGESFKININNFQAYLFNIAIKAEEADINISNAQISHSDELGDVAIFVQTSNIELVNVEIRNYNNGILTNNVNNFVVDNLKIENTIAGAAGIEMFDLIVENNANNCRFNNIQILGFQIGISTASFNQSLIITNAQLRVFETGDVSSYGIYVDHGHNVILQNVQTLNYFTGIELEECQNVNIVDAQIYGFEPVRSEFNVGIECFESDQLIIKNLAIRNYFVGVGVTNNGLFEITDASIVLGINEFAPGIISSGIFLIANHFSSLIQNVNIAGFTAGLWLVSAKEVRVKDCIIADSFYGITTNGNGVQTNDERAISVENSTFLNTIGIDFLDTTNCEVKNCTFSLGANGIILTNCNTTKIDNNLFNGMNNGINLTSDTRNTFITKNDIGDVLVTGIEVQNQVLDTIIESNKILSSGVYGILVAGQYTLIKDNIVNSSGVNGLFLDGSRNIFSGNYFINNSIVVNNAGPYPMNFDAGGNLVFV